jgi:hypothetical protein
MSVDGILHVTVAPVGKTLVSLLAKHDDDTSVFLETPVLARSHSLYLVAPHLRSSRIQN